MTKSLEEKVLLRLIPDLLINKSEKIDYKLEIESFDRRRVKVIRV